MSNGKKFPGPYQGDVRRDDAMMIYVPMDTMNIGARKSGMPKSASEGPKSLEHVGGSEGNRGAKGK